MTEYVTAFCEVLIISISRSRPGQRFAPFRKLALAGFPEGGLE